MNVLAIIPARGGSKGVKKKNIRCVAGQPLIHYSIKAAHNSQLINRLIVSTDCQEIAEVAGEADAEVLIRPKEFATDSASMLPVVDHVLEKVEKEDGPVDIILLLQPTTPMRTSEDIDQALEALISSDHEGTISVYQVDDCHPARMYTIADQQLIPFCNEDKEIRRQELPAVYHRNGAIYGIKRDAYAKHHSLMSGKLLPFVMPIERSVNIDNELDLKLAELLIQGH